MMARIDVLWLDPISTYFLLSSFCFVSFSLGFMPDPAGSHGASRSQDIGFIKKPAEICNFEKEEDTSRKISNFYPMGIAGIGVTGRCALKI
jgi:hypothetical protein